MPTPILGVTYYSIGSDPLWHAYGRPDIAPESSAIAAAIAGSAPVGTTQYDVPTGALFVSLSGSDSNPGTLGSPKRSIAAAIDASVSGGTIVLRAGVFRGERVGTKTKPVTIQAYPGEAVWVDGSAIVTGFTGSGPWVKTGWTTEFDNVTPPVAGDAWSRYVLAAAPLANWPDMVFIDGVRQTLVSGTPGAGQFAVDYAANTLTIGTNPSGKVVEASTVDLFANLQGAGTVLRGFGIRRYATPLASMGATLILSGASAGSRVENMVFEDCGIQSLSVRGHHSIVSQVDIIRAGAVGLHVPASGDDLLIDRLYVSEANMRHFKHQPISAGMKFSPNSDRVTVRDSIVEDSDCAGIWFDTDCANDVVFGNLVQRCTDVAILNEANTNMLIVGNYALNNRGGIMSTLAGTAFMWNNWADGNQLWDVACLQDSRRPWLSNNVQIANNVFAGSIKPSNKLFQAYALDNGSGVPAPQMVSLLAGNLFSALSGDGVSSNRMIGWDTNGDNAVGSPEIHKTVSAFKTVTGWDNTSTPIQDLTPAQVASFDSAARAIPANVAAVLSVLVGAKLMGPARPRPVRSS